MISLIACIKDAAIRRKTALWLVGGPVRDGLLGKACDDWDMVCRKAKPIALEVAKRLQAKFISLDEQNRIYRVILPSPQPRQTSGESPAVLATSPTGRELSTAAGEGVRTLDFAELQGRTIEEDLGRRDFTINAMAGPLTQPSGALSRGERMGRRDIIDPFNGQGDLDNKIIRAVSEKAFAQDPLRLLRAFRFAAQFQSAIEPRTLRWIKKYRDGLPEVAEERVREEFLRLWKQPGCGTALRLMDDVRLLSKIFPEIEACRRTAIRYYGKGGVLKHSFETVENLEWIFKRIDQETTRTRDREQKPFLAVSKSRGLPVDPISQYLQTHIGGYPRLAWLKWAAFLHDVGKPATAKVIKGRLRFFEHEHVGAGLAIRAAQRLRCSRQEGQLLGLWVRNHMRTGNLAAATRITGKAVSRFFRDLGIEGVGMVLVSLADHYTYLRKSLWGKGTDPVEKMGCRLLTSYFEEHSKILPDRLIDGHHLMRRLKLKPGPIIGRLLEDIQDAQAEGKVRTKDEAVAFAKKLLRKLPRPSYERPLPKGRGPQAKSK